MKTPSLGENIVNAQGVESTTVAQRDVRDVLGVQFRPYDRVLSKTAVQDDDSGGDS